jgi:glycogen debranching enzyme
LIRRQAIKVTALTGAAMATFPRVLCQSSSASSSKLNHAELAKRILADRDLQEVHGKARKLLSGGLNAGTGYLNTWIRDMNTFIQVALQVNPPQRFREALLMFFKFQGADGNIIDCYSPKAPDKIKPTDRTSPLAPGFVAGKNTVEADQESSLVQAVYKYINATQDRSILEENVAGVTVRERLGQAMNFLLTQRFDPTYGLVWGGTTLDWGDVQPESPRGVVLDASSHSALSIYDNAMLLIALNNFVELPGTDRQTAAHWSTIRDHLRKNIRKYLWDEKRQKFFPHVYLAGSPFPKNFDENAIYYHGGTAVAIEAGLLSRPEVAYALDRMEQDVRLAGASSIGLTLYPPYPLGFFKNPQTTVPYTYQNGGDWTWFGGRMIQQLVRHEFPEAAYRDIRPMVERVQRTGDFHEWWTRDNQPRGSAQFRGSAGVLGQAIEMLQAWAKQFAS